MLILKCAIFGDQKSRCYKKPEVNGILSSLGLKTSLRKIPLFGDVLLWMQFHWITIKWMK